MKNTIKELYEFQKIYLIKILENIPEDKLFFNQEKGINSPGWILGHLIVEIEDIAEFLKIELKPIPNSWKEIFKGGQPWKFEFQNELPKKTELIESFITNYDYLLNEYLNLSEEIRQKKHPSKMFAQLYTNVDAWFAHHIITHFAVHSGNITMWKKMNAINVEGL